MKMTCYIKKQANFKPQLLLAKKYNLTIRVAFRTFEFYTKGLLVGFFDILKMNVH